MEKILVDKVGILGNRLISSYLEKDEPFSVCRIGLTEMRWVDWFIRGGMESDCDGIVTSEGKYYTPTLSDKMSFHGVYGGYHDYFFEEFNNGIRTADIQIFWENIIEREQNNIFNVLSPNSYKVSFDSLNPTKHIDFWSKKLKNKKVLLVHQCENTIRLQYTNREKIWVDGHVGKIPEMQISTFKPVWVLGNNKPHNSWKDSLEYMKSEISKMDFDVAILACCYFGMPLINFIKNEMNRSCIYMGGDLQILFGIMGTRWDQTRAGGFYNDNWVRCLPIDIPFVGDKEDLPGTDNWAYF